MSALLLVCGCTHQPSDDEVLTASRPLHLEEHLAGALIQGSSPPEAAGESPNWKFGSPDHGWQALTAPGAEAVEVIRLDGAIRLPLTTDTRSPLNDALLEGYVYTSLPDLDFEDWSYLEVTAQATGIRNMGLVYNYTEDDRQFPDDIPFYAGGSRLPVMSDGTVQTYRIPLEASRRRRWDGPWTHVALWFNADPDEVSPALDLLSMRLVSAQEAYADEPVGVRLVGSSARGESGLPSGRRSLFMHAPGSVSFRVRVPQRGRLDVGLGTIGRKMPVSFSVTATADAGEPRVLFDELQDTPGTWAQRSIDLGRFGGKTITLTLATDSERAGSVALWAAPTVSGARSDDQPNIILYVIDGGGSDYIGPYNYVRNTTPNLDRLASQGAVFERAHSNSSWTRPSTASFLTSLQHSTMGGLAHGRNTVPEEIPTLAEHLHRAGYQTAELTTNSNAGSISGLDRGNDVFRDAGSENYSISSRELQDSFWAWREAYPGEPYLVHFQTTDVHNPHASIPPFSGLFVGSDLRRTVDEWTEMVEEIPETDDVRIGEALVLVGGDEPTYWAAQRDLFDECMAHQDVQLGRLVARLRATGEWENTLLVITADHSVAAGSWDYDLLMRSPQPKHVYHDDWGTPIFRSGVSQVPLILVWPGHIEPGQRYSHPVSLIDLLPTLLDLADLPPPEVKQGHSLAPLLLGRGDWQPQPVFLDEFEADRETGELRGRIEIVDGRWGASLLINEDPETHERFRRESPLLLCDLWEDPACLDSLHQQRPDLVDTYTRLLERQFQAHLDLGKLFDAADDAPLTRDQLEALRALGYIQ